VKRNRYALSVGRSPNGCFKSNWVSKYGEAFVKKEVRICHTGSGMDLYHDCCSFLQFSLTQSMSRSLFHTEQ
jgi:hypothetical protein